MSALVANTEEKTVHIWLKWEKKQSILLIHVHTSSPQKDSLLINAAKRTASFFSTLTKKWPGSPRNSRDVERRLQPCTFLVEESRSCPAHSSCCCDEYEKCGQGFSICDIYVCSWLGSRDHRLQRTVLKKTCTVILHRWNKILWYAPSSARACSWRALRENHYYKDCHTRSC